MKSFIDLDIKRKYATKSKYTPLDFYCSVIPNSKAIYFKLGYFSSYALSVLALPLTHFLLKDGVLNIVTNHVYKKEDAENLLDIDLSEDQLYKVGKMLKDDPEEFKEVLRKGTELFYDCLNYLQKKERLIIQPVLFGEEYGLSHFKEFVAEDFNDNYINATGSCNLTANGILKNGESFAVIRSWDSTNDEVNILNEKEAIKRILNGVHPDFHFANPDRILKVIQEKSNNKELNDLLDDAKEYSNRLLKVNEDKHKVLLENFAKAVEEFETCPRRPDWFSPRKYQIEAYQNWIINNSKGLFAMATGTGKTLTAINILEREYKSKGISQAIILVPTKTLAYQWLEDLEKFNFTKILFTVDNSKWYSEYSRLLRRIDNYNHCIILTTYATFNSKRFQTGLNELDNKNSLILVGDEVHNIGSPISLRNLPHNISNRIGLSATPERVYDETGTKEIEEYFQSYAPEFTYRYSMKKAIEDQKLCPYDYFPRLVMLDEDELNDYKEISRKLMNYFDSKTGKFSVEANNLLMLRKRIIHKARRKRGLLSKIINELEQSKGEKINYAFVYVPEGKDERYINEDSYNSSEEDEKVINQYADLLIEKGYRLYKFIGGLKNRKVVLENFKSKKLQILLAMKCLDEGVNVPRTEIGIFCSSTGNPRQFIQRRGRLLRTHPPEKKKAIIYDMIVAPPISDLNNVNAESLSNMEINLFKSEVKRVANFAYMADNKEEIHDSDVFRLASQIGVGIYEMINENLQNDE